MYSHPDVARFFANERQADMLRDADNRRLAREARGEHVSLFSRLRGRLARVLSRERRVFRPARSES
jgi:hypothetical protein